MASALNETGHREESVRSNPAAVLGGDTAFFGSGSSARGAEKFLAFTGELVLLIVNPGRYSESRMVRSFGVAQKKLRSDPDAVLSFDAISSLFFSSRETSEHNLGSRFLTDPGGAL